MVDVFNIALSSRRACIFPDRRDVAIVALDFTATTRCKRLTPASGSLCVRYLRLLGTKTIPSTMSSEKSMVARRRTVVPDGDETRLSTGASARRHRTSRHRPENLSVHGWTSLLSVAAAAARITQFPATSPSSSRLGDSSGDRSRTSNPLAAGCRQVLDTTGTGTGNGKGPKQVASSAAANRCLQPC